MRAYLTEGELMTDHAMLQRVAVEVGLPEDEVRDVLATDRYEAWDVWWELNDDAFLKKPYEVDDLERALAGLRRLSV